MGNGNDNMHYMVSTKATILATITVIPLVAMRPGAANAHGHDKALQPEMVYINVPGCEWPTRSALNRGRMQAIKAMFVKSLVVIGIIPSNLLAAAEVAEHPTRVANRAIQLEVSVLSKIGGGWSFVKIPAVRTVRSIVFGEYI